MPHLNKTREWDSSAYHRLSDPQFGWGLKVLERLPLRGNEVVLDAGCGTGRVTAELAARLPQGRVAAVDLSENMVRTARDHMSVLGARVLYACADTAELPFRQAFDGIFSTATFHWVKDHEKLFRDLYGALMPGGWLIAQCGGGPNLARLRNRARELMATPRFAPFFAGWSEPQNYADEHVTAARLRAAGFVQVQTSLEPASLTLPTMELFREYLGTVTFHQHIKRIPDAALREEFLMELAHKFRQDPEFELDYWRLNLSGWKER